jgi:hypothetical protein
LSNTKLWYEQYTQKGVIIYLWPFETIWLFEICKKEEIRPTKVRKLDMGYRKKSIVEAISSFSQNNQNHSTFVHIFFLKS